MSFRDFLKKEFRQDLDSIISDFYKKTVEEIGHPPETLIGGFTYIRTYLDNGGERVFYYIGGKENIKVLETSNKIKSFYERFGKKIINDFIKSHEKHEVYFETTPTSVGEYHSIVCSDCNKKSQKERNEFIKEHGTHDLGIHHLYTTEEGDLELLTCGECREENRIINGRLILYTPDFFF